MLLRSEAGIASHSVSALCTVPGYLDAVLLHWPLAVGAARPAISDTAASNPTVPWSYTGKSCRWGEQLTPLALCAGSSEPAINSQSSFVL